MATTKNIIMKQFNGTDYDTLYPKTVAAQVDGVYSKDETYPKSQLYTQSQLYTKEQVLSDATKILYGLGSSAIPDDAFVASVEANTGYIHITTKTSSGVVAGMPIMIDGVYAGKTGANGKARISVPFGAHTIKVVRPLDIASITPDSFNINVTDVNAIVLESTCVLSTATEATISTSGNYGFSDRVEDFDACVVGGGGSGGAVSASSGIDGAAGGGGGGYVVNQYNLSAKTFNCFSAIIGAGGSSVSAKGSGTSSQSDFTAGKDGGISSITSQLSSEEIKALGGKAGDASSRSTNGGDGGSGGGAGHGYQSQGGAGGTDGGDGETIDTFNQGTGTGGKGQGTTTRPFGDTSKTPLSPGGGGVGCKEKGSGNAGTAQTNGSPGAYADSSNVSAVAGTIMGSGGGAAITHNTTYTATSAKGTDGGILLRWRFKS